MELNVANWNRAVRVVLGIAILSLMFVGPKTLWGFLGFIPLFSGLAGHCPFYRMIGISTCRHGKHGGKKSAAAT